ncbi:MAG: hypothetical protein ACYC1U_06790 [Candidatus Aquicultorales bacterium]
MSCTCKKNCPFNDVEGPGVIPSQAWAIMSSAEAMEGICPICEKNCRYLKALLEERQRYRTALLELSEIPSYAGRIAKKALAGDAE